MNPFKNRVVGYLIWRFVLRKPKFRAVLQRVLIRQRQITLTLLGADLVIDTRLEMGYHRAARLQADSIVFRDEVPKLLLVASLLRPGTTFVDCGANVGLWSFNVARLAPLHPGLKVLAFEAHPDTFARLARGAARYPAVSCHNVALSTGTGFIEMSEGAGSGTFGVDTSFTIGGTARRVATRALDDFIAGIADMVVKIDVEGHEYEVLQGAATALAEGRIRAVLIDGIAAGTRALAHAFLRARGYDVLDAASLAVATEDHDRIIAMRRIATAPVAGPLSSTL